MSTPTHPKLFHLNLSVRARSQPGNLRFSDALFQQALVQHDDAAWAMLQERYQVLVCTWIKAKLTTGADEACLQQLAQQAFAKLRAAFVRHPQKFDDFPNRAALLGLLRLCAERAALTGLALLLALSVTQPIQHPVPMTPASLVTAGATDHLAFYHQQMKIEADDRVVPGATPNLLSVVADEEPGGIACHAGIAPGHAVCIF